MGAPPSPNIVAEIFIIWALIVSNWSLSFFLLLIAGFATAFTLILYIITQHLQTSALIKKMYKWLPYETLLLNSHAALVLVGTILAVS